MGDPYHLNAIYWLVAETTPAKKYKTHHPYLHCPHIAHLIHKHGEKELKIWCPTQPL